MLDNIDIEILQLNNYSANQVIDPATLVVNSFAWAFVKYITDDIGHPTNPFRVDPFRLFVIKEDTPNAKAIFCLGRYCIVIHHSVLELIGEIVFKKIRILFPVEGKLNHLIQKDTDSGLPSFVFQLLTLYIYNHELAHLNQYRNQNNTSSQLQQEYCDLTAGNNFDPRSHAMEIDADIFAATEVAYSIFKYWQELQPLENSADLLYSLVALFGSCIFLFWQTMQGGWPDVYFLNYSHPHIMVRVTYMLDCMTSVLEGKGDPNVPFSRDTCQLITLELAFKLLDEPQGNGIRKYWKLFEDNIDDFEEYSKKHMVPISKKLRFLVQWNRPVPNL